MWKVKPDYVTFVIPTKGRDTLKKTIQSLLDQSDWNWRGYILFDGIEPIKINGLSPDIDYLTDNHFIVKSCEYKGHAGLVRNEALPLVDTKWTAFLDDDDFLSPTYINALKRYDTSFFDIVIFTYRDIENGNTQPPPYLDKIVRCNVGISFAIKTKFMQENNILFPLGGIEDYAFLESSVEKGGRYIITHSIQYYVGHRSAWA